MKLGNFSVSLTVKDLEASKNFYQKLGFEIRAGDQSQGWLVLSNGDVIIGLFQNMFERNMLTFNPGWDKNKQTLQSFTDIRTLQQIIKAKGIQPTLEADESSIGPAAFIVEDPDGNPILFDQHV